MNVVVVAVLSGLGIVSAQKAGSEGAPRPIEPTSWFAADNYPAEALRKRQSGYVRYSVEVDAMGHPVSCAITMSSNAPSLDAMTCELVMKKARFLPAFDSTKQAVASRYEGKTQWVLPAPPHGMIALTVLVQGSGEEVTCETEVDGKARYLVSEMCVSLVNSVTVQGGRIDIPLSVHVPDGMGYFPTLIKELRTPAPRPAG